MCPANKAIDKAGIISINPIKPKYKGSPVSSYTFHSITMNCMDHPKINAKRTIKKILNSLILNAAYGSFLDMCGLGCYADFKFIRIPKVSLISFSFTTIVISFVVEITSCKAMSAQANCFRIK